MVFRGLFFGIDRYSDSRIPWLSGAVRDARGLHALFSDSLGDGSTLLSDEAATAGAMRGAFADLAAMSTRDDVVVIGYAGHGSEDHHLLTYDADVARIPETCISLDEVGELISATPGGTLLCLLDCCFSGGLGARVLATGLRPRRSDQHDITVSLERFTGEGRVVFTASADDEEAHESARHGQGLFTYRLLEALQGASEVRDGNMLSLYRVVEHVTHMVQGDALQMGRKQTPTLRGKVDGVPLWPILKPGSRYAAVFPDRVRPPAKEDISSLSALGFSPQVIQAWAGAIPKLNELQLAAINEFGVLDGESIVVTAPTSSGKTMIGELAALRSALERQRAVFLLPMRALVNDKYEQFEAVYGPSGLRTIRATGEYSDDVPSLLRGQFDIALLTYEKYTALALGNPHVLDLAATVVIDEAQTLADPSRGSNLEFLLTLLNNRRGKTGVPQIITLSAVVGDLGGLDRWIGGRNLHSGSRPVPLVEGVLDESGTYHHLAEDGTESSDSGFIEPLYTNGSRRLLIPLVQKLTSEKKKVLVFRQSKGEAVACAMYLTQALSLAEASGTLARLVEGDISTSSSALRRTLSGGVAFHNTDLDRDERRAIEQDFRDPNSPLRIVVATPTLAMGVNTPASAVAIVGLTHPGARPTPYTVAEYKNMVGRAGRLGFTERGESYLLPEGALDSQRAWAGFVNGKLEDLTSKLVPDGDPRSLMLRVLATYPPDAVGVVSEEDVVGFLDSSFAAFQAREGGSSQWTAERLRQGFEQLVSADLIGADGGGYSLTVLGRFTGESGVHVDSIRRLVHALRPCATDLNSVALMAAAQLTNELDDVYLPVNARARNTEVLRWPALLIQQQVPRALVQALQTTVRNGAQAVRRCKRAAAAAMWVSGLPIETIELQLTQHMPQRGGVAGAVRATADRTRDLLPAVAAVVGELAPEQPVDDLVARTMLRLELGVPAELVDLIRATNLQLTRAEWLRLHGARLTALDTVRAASAEELETILGSAAAANRLSEACAAASESPSAREVDVKLPSPSE